MANESYWNQVFSSLEQMTDEEFIEFVNENGGFEYGNDSKCLLNEFEHISISIKGNGLSVMRDDIFSLQDVVNSHFEVPVSGNNSREIVLKCSENFSAIFSDDDDLEAA